MTIPRVADMIRKLIPTWRNTLTHEEQALAPHLRGNAPLHESLVELISSRITQRASLPVPVDPVICRGFIERDHELRWLLGRLKFVFHSPINPPAQGSEPPE